MTQHIDLNKRAIESSLRWLQDSAGHPALTSPMSDLLGLLAPNGAHLQRSPNKLLLTTMREYLNKVDADLRNTLKNALTLQIVCSYASDDFAKNRIGVLAAAEVLVHHLHVELRSLADHVASAVLTLWGEDFDDERVSFSDVLDEKYKSKAAYSTLNEIRGFYSATKRVRDSIVHRGGEAIADAQQQGTYTCVKFNVFQDGESVVDLDKMSLPASLDVGGQIDFESYFGLCVARWLEYLGEIAKQIIQELNTRGLLITEETHNTSFPSTMPALIVAGVRPQEALRLMKTVESVTTHSTVSRESFVPGTPTIVEFILRVKSNLDSQASP